jgi:DNA gyrase subunit A
MMLISDQGTLVRTRIDEVSITSRNTQGVRLIRLADDEALVGVERIEEPTDAGELREVDGTVEPGDEIVGDETDDSDDMLDTGDDDGAEPSED